MAPGNNDDPLQVHPAIVRILQRRSSTLLQIINALNRIDARRLGTAGDTIIDTISDLRRVEDDVTYAHEQLQGVSQNLQASQQTLQRQADDYRTRMYRAQDEVRGLTNSLAESNQRADRLQRDVAAYQDSLDQYQRATTNNDRVIAEQTTTIQELERELRRIRGQSGGPPSSTGTGVRTPFGASGGPGRSSSDSGYSEATTSVTDPGQETRQRLARTLLDDAVTKVKAGHFKQAEEGFAQVVTILGKLPTALRAGFDTTRIAYYRTFCRAETSTDAEAERCLVDFQQSHPTASLAQQASIEHLLARTYVKLDRIDDAENHAYVAVGLWHQANPDSEAYFNAIALLVRIFYLQSKDAQALAIIRPCPESRKDYVRERYRTLGPTPAATTRTSGVGVLPARPTPRTGTGTTGSTARAPPSTATTGTRRSTSTTASKREARLRAAAQLPAIFRMALPPGYLR